MKAAPAPADPWPEFSASLAHQGYCLIVPKGAGRYAALHPFLFTWAIIEGAVGDLCGYDDRWCFASFEKAAEGLNDWLLRGFAGEPQGWHRHPATGRRRPEGDPAAEYVAR